MLNAFHRIAMVAGLLTLWPMKAEPETRGKIEVQEMIGVWEAIDVRSLKLFVADIHEQAYQSFVSMVGPDALTFSVHSMVAKGRHVEFLCDGRGNASSYSLKIVGDGWAAAGEGVLDATISLRDADGKRIYNTWHVPMYGYKGKFVQTFYDARRLADESIAAAVGEAAARDKANTQSRPPEPDQH